MTQDELFNEIARLAQAAEAEGHTSAAIVLYALKASINGRVDDQLAMVVRRFVEIKAEEQRGLLGIVRISKEPPG